MLMRSQSVPSLNGDKENVTFKIPKLLVDQ
jgi:hypothetical protein